MWSVAAAAIMEQPQREMVFVVAARSIRSLYMHAALCRLALFPNVKLIPMVSEPQQISHAIQSGRPTDHLPKLSPDDVVYTAGAPAMTDAVARIAKAAGTRCYTDPFVQEPRTAGQAGLMSRLTGWLNEPKRRLPFRCSRPSRKVLAAAWPEQPDRSARVVRYHCAAARRIITTSRDDASLVRRASIDEEDKQQERDCKAYPRDRIPDIVADKRCEQSNSAQDADDKRRGKYLTQGLMRTFHGDRHDAAAESFDGRRPRNRTLDAHAGLPPAHPKIDAGNQHHDRKDIKQRPQHFQRHAAIVTEMQGLRNKQRRDVPGHVARIGQLTGLGVNQRRLQQPRGDRRIATQEDAHSGSCC